MTEADTIFAPATGAVAAAIAVVRISGARTAAILRDLAGAVPPARRASLRHLRDAEGAALDTALVLWFPPPRSYTGEAMAELHLHGGRAVVAGVLDALVALDARPAEPGEFTRRAFLRGRMDLVQAEGIADLIAAETAAQRRLAMQQADGHASAALAGWAETLRETLAWQEALIDFPDDGIPSSVETELAARCVTLKAALDAAIQAAQGAGRVRAGLVIAVIGKPNVGKSTLVNALAGRDVAITADTPGTTRDMLEVPLALGDLPVTLVDTAGLRDAADPVEQEGVRRARAKAASADLIVEVVAVPAVSAEHPDSLVICNKADLGPPPAGMIGVSARTGAGLDRLRAALRERAQGLVGTLDAAALSRPRHVAALREAAHWIDQAATPAAPELRAEALRLGLRAISRITGAVDIDTMLDTIFGQFCIGK